MIRIVVQTTDVGDALYVGGPAHVSVKTFDLYDAALEQFLKEHSVAVEKARTNQQGVYWSRQVIGVEYRDE